MRPAFSSPVLRLWAAAVAAILLTDVMLLRTGLAVGGPVGRYAVNLAYVALLCLLRRPDWPIVAIRLVDFFEALALLSTFCLAGAVATYCVSTGHRAYADDLLAAADRALGFDWPAAYRYTAAHPLVARFGHMAYMSIFATPFVLLAGLTLSGRTARARRLVAAYGLAVATTLAAFAFFPARSAMIHHVGRSGGYMPSTGIFVDTIDSLRAGTLAVVPLDHLEGLVSFPSFHAASAALFAWAAWPVRWLRWPMLAVNGAMLAATPVEGSHYFVDVLAGLLVAAASVAAVSRRPAAQATASTTLPTWSPASR